MRFTTCNAPALGRAASLLVIAAPLLVGCSRQAEAPAERARPVKSVVVTANEGLQVRSFPGTVEASKRVELAFQVPGLLVKLPVKEGQQVAKGELIAQLRQDEFQARLIALTGQLDRARAQLTALRAGERPEEQLRRESLVRAAEARLQNARADMDRASRLVQGRTITQAQYDEQEAAYRVAVEDLKSAVQLRDQGTVGRQEDIQAKEAEVRGLEGQVVDAKLQLDDSALLAPYDGVIAQRFVEEGQNVMAKAPIVRFQDIEEIEIAVDVPETVMVVDIRTADIVQLVAQLSGAPGIEIPVAIREISQVADPTTQTFKVRVAMQAPPGIQALPGMTATVTATYRRASILGDRILVPIAAVGNDTSDGAVAWIITPEGTVARRPVRTGEATGSQIEIVEGLQPGDRIVVAGVSQLREGMKVRELGDVLQGGRS